MGEGSSRNELIGALSVVILFVTILAGREAGHFYAEYQELNKLKVLLEVSEEELSRYILNRDGSGTGMNIGLTITLPRVENEADIVTETPDYVRRWLISVTLSPVTVRQPSVSDVQMEMLVEGETVHNETYSFPKRKVSYLGYVDRELDIRIADLDSLQERINEAASRYGGEVRIELKGKVKAHLWFLDTWLPFSTTRYPFLETPHLVYEDSEWTSLEGVTTTESTVNKTVFVRVKLSNPTRFHTIRENVTCAFYHDGMAEPFDVILKEVPIAPSNEGHYVFSLTPEIQGEYFYSFETMDRILLEKEDAKVLTVNP